MTWLEILWQSFWRSLLWRQHERPYSRATLPAAPRTPMGENRDEKAVVLVDRHSAGCLRVARFCPLSNAADDKSPRRACVAVVRHTSREVRLLRPDLSLCSERPEALDEEETYIYATAGRIVTPMTRLRATDR